MDTPLARALLRLIGMSPRRTRDHPISPRKAEPDRAMHAAALLTSAAPSAASGAAPEPGASSLDDGKAGAPGQVDAFTQALAALLGLPAQPPTPQGTTSAAPNSGDPRLPAATPPSPLPHPLTFTLPAPANGAQSNGAQGNGAQSAAATFALAAVGPLAAGVPAKAVAAPGLGAAPNATPQQPSAVAQPPAPRGASAPNAVSRTLATLSVTGRIQSELTAPPSDDASEATAAATSSALTPLAVGASRLDLALQPAQVAAPKAGPTAPQTKTAAKTDSTSTAQGAASATEDEPPIEALHAAADTADDQGQQAGGHASSQTAAAQGQNAQPAASDASTNAATTLAVAPGAAVAQALTTSSTIASPIASQLATQVVKAVEGKSTHFDIALEPAGFGRVDVKLQIDPQGQVSAQFSFDTAHAAAEAKAQVGQLQQALEQAGFTVGQGGLSFDVGGRGAGLAGQQSQPAQQWAPVPAQPDALAEATAAAAQILARSPASGLDITI